MSPENTGSRQNLDAAYYQELHNSNPAFQNNNWLTDELPVLAAWGGKSILEVGCGNGRFLLPASRQWDEVVGVDWARSPVLDKVLGQCPSVRFVQADARTMQFDRQFDLVVSADFLEHLAEEALPAVLVNLHRLGRINFHKIACYDDGHSHLSILPPEKWLELFQQAAPQAGYRLHTVKPRKGDATKLVITLTNAPA